MSGEFSVENRALNYEQLLIFTGIELLCLNLSLSFREIQCYWDDPTKCATGW